jgi:hypothetical protein
VTKQSNQPKNKPFPRDHLKEQKSSDQECWLTAIIPALRKLRQEDREFETSLAFIARSCFKREKERGKEEEEEKKILPQKNKHCSLQQALTSHLASLFFFPFIHMCIQCLGHFSSLPPTSPL